MEEVAVAREGVDVGPAQEPYASAKLAAVLPSLGCELLCNELN